ITSTSSEGISSVIVQFTDRANNDLIGSTVERQVSAALGKLPADAERPIVTKLDPNAQPVMQIAVVGDRLAPEDLFNVADHPVRLRDVATVGLTAKDATQLTRVNGRQGVLLRIGQQNGTNTTDVADAVQAALPALRGQLPPGADLIVIQDTSQFVRTSIGGVR